MNRARLSLAATSDRRMGSRKIPFSEERTVRSTARERSAVISRPVGRDTNLADWGSLRSQR